MLKEKCFELKWINDIKKNNNQLHSVYVENTIYAFELLSELVKLGIDFVFKGGTSLLIHFLEPRRLSTDVDIIGDFDLTILNKIIERNHRFRKMQEAVRSHNRPKIKNLEFYYNTVIPGFAEQFVILDIVNIKPNYPNIVKKQIKCNLLETDEDLVVKIPSVESLLGDKLTAFAPNMIGIPLEDDQFRPVNVIKQLFDISLLFDSVSDLSEIYEAYKISHDLNCRIRNQKYEIDETLDDTINTCITLSSDGFSDRRNYAQIIISKGCNRLNQFLIAETFSMQIAKKHSAKVALMATILKKKRFDLILSDLRFTKKKIDQLKNTELSSRYNKLAPLKESDVEAFYYWYLVSKLEK